MQVKHLLLIAILALTTVYSSNKETVDEDLNESQLCQQAQDDLNNKNYNSAVTRLKALRPCCPFGRYTKQAQLELICASYKNIEPEAARAAAEHFIRLRPQHPNIDYAYYLKGLSSFDRGRGLLARFLPPDTTKRNPGAVRDSFSEFARLANRFPGSRYASDAKMRMVYLRNLLAAYEVHVDHYYLKRQAYITTVNRSRYVVGNFQETPAVGDDLAIAVETYRRPGLDDLTSASLETLKLNYPDNTSLKDGEFVTHESEADTRSWLAGAALGLIEDGEPSPHIETQVAKDVIKQYENAEREIPTELKPKNQDHSIDDERPESDDGEDSSRSWWSYVTFGLFD